jgi:hypothetical protein
MMLELNLYVIGQRPVRARLLFVQRRPLFEKYADEVIVAVYARSLERGRH